MGSSGFSDSKNKSWAHIKEAFQTTSEALQLGKKILVKPHHGQKEQESNVLALEKLNLAESIIELINFSEKLGRATSWIKTLEIPFWSFK